MWARWYIFFLYAIKTHNFKWKCANKRIILRVSWTHMLFMWWNWIKISPFIDWHPKRKPNETVFYLWSQRFFWLLFWLESGCRFSLYKLHFMPKVGTNDGLHQPRTDVGDALILLKKPSKKITTNKQRLPRFSYNSIADQFKTRKNPTLFCMAWWNMREIEDNRCTKPDENPFYAISVWNMTNESIDFQAWLFFWSEL